MIPIGQRCEECGKIHIIKSMDEFENLSPRMKAQAYRTEHRIFRDKYFTSCVIDPETIWEIYFPLSVFKIERVQEEESESEEDKQKEEFEQILDSDEEED
jgi:hypothetical protein